VINDGLITCSYMSMNKFMNVISMYTLLCSIQGGPKNGLFLRVDNFAMVNRRKACDMSEVSEFCLEKE